ncbi:MAG TPA: STAS domain-containing protein [Candidatus Acidoferrales bacterium]|nr:STAS domain-containing protein [Candidatus Acidoferrales bacterium]
MSLRHQRDFMRPLGYDEPVTMGLRSVTVSDAESWARILSVDGELDIGSAAQFAKLIEDGLRDGRPLVIDLTACTYLDSTILNVLIRSANLAPQRIGIVVPTVARIRRIFNIAGLEEALHLAESRSALQGRFPA